MAFYQTRGEFPQKKHITYYKENGKDLYWEELFSTRGFSGIYSTKYHIHPPTKVLEVEHEDQILENIWQEGSLQPFHFYTDKVHSEGNYLTARQSFLTNKSVNIATAKITENCSEFFKNGFAHELVFVHHGKGVYKSEYGNLPLQDGDYLVIPKGTIGQFHFDDLSNVKLLIVESNTPYEIPSHFRNEYGQILEHAPYSERDFKTPQFVDPIDETGEFTVRIKFQQQIHNYKVQHHPFDVVGWDGYHYPYTFNIKDYAPIVGKIHMPPPVHLVFTTESFVVCNFVPRLFDFHPQAIPAPYFHSNVDSDEVLYYAEGDFMSRKGIEEGSITLHPGGIPHGPQPGKIEASIGKKEADEYAVMIDTFEPLHVTKNVQESMDPNYIRSWL